MFFMYRYLYLQYPEKPLTSYITEVFGKYLGWMIGLCYIVYFLNISMRVLRDFGDLLLVSTLPKTPLLPINAFMILAVSYILFHVIEVI
ncbi:hypothetical protein DS031_18575 [Bacillus taeanensis]|uniref:Uncharacterized protein n=1 Tax=Bacillus taeanensis TaxID=273032 RepID=A0A366XVA1_9BACI|nr:hypothetical protein DS031_18575 [Bacillus taeanensis]